ncbi:MAG: hypothetical protein ABI564_15055 [Ideonella sp.]
MNVNTLIAALTLTIGAAAPGLAAATPAMQDHMRMSRVEVNADIAASNHGYAARGEGYSESTPASTLSREQVSAELQAARAQGALADRTELYGSFRQSQITSTLSRADVMAQASIEASRIEQQYAGA